MSTILRWPRRKSKIAKEDIIPSEKYTYYVSSSANQVEFNFSTGSIGTATSTTLGYEITGSDEFGIVGKFKEL